MKRKAAFTLIELMVVIAVIAILATLGVISYTTSLQRSRDGVRKADIQNIAQALILYRADNNGYPTVAQFEDKILVEENYMAAIPKDEAAAENNQDYVYACTDNSNASDDYCRTFSLCTPEPLEYPMGNANSELNTKLVTCTNEGEDSSACEYYCVANP